MSVLFKHQYSYEQQENSYHNRHQNVRKIGQKDKRGRGPEESMLVFGYACTVYDDVEKAVYFDEGRHLMPWMGDESLMIDRFDGRLLLEDISPFISKGSDQDDTWQLSYDEQEMERMCDIERYQALENDNAGGSDDEEEEMKRFKAAIASEGGSYSAVGMNYNEQYYPQYTYDATQVHAEANVQYYPSYTEEQAIIGPASLLPEEPSIVPLLHQQQQQQLLEQQQQIQQQQQQDLLQQQQQEQEIEVFVPPEELNIPADMEVPDTAKLHTIIERTAFFIKDHGAQMEIVLKAKQSGNPQFEFLSFDNRLNPYYKLILKAVRSGSYEPAKPATPPQEEEDSDDDSDDDMEMHPLLTASLRTPIVSSKKVPPLGPPPLPPGWTAVNPDAPPGTNSFSMRADNFLAGMDVVGQSTGYPPGFPVYPHTHPGILPPPPPPPGVEPPNGSDPSHQFPSGIPPMYYANYPGNPAMSLAGPMSSYPGTDTQSGPPIIPPPPDIKPICDKLAGYVARNGKQFEDNIRAKNDPRFDFINQTSDLYTYYQTKIREFELDPVESGNKSSDDAKSGLLEPSTKPVSFQIKTKTNKGTVMEYRRSVLYKTAKADDSDEEGIDEDDTENQDDKDSSQNGEAVEAPKPDVHGPKTQEDMMAEERATKLKQEKEMEVQRLEEEAKSTTSSLRRQVQLERRRRAQLFINMLKKAKPGAPESSPGNQAGSDDSEPPAPS